MLLLAYASTAAREFLDGDLISLLMSSRANNRRLGLTGILLHDDSHFIQVLEGDDAVVRERFALIERDSRHTDLRVLLEQQTVEREFPKWTMGYKSLSDPLIASIPGYDAFFTRSARESDAPVRELLERFRLDATLGDLAEATV